MSIIAVALLFGAVLCGLAAWADARFRHERRLPMQWRLSGAVTWSAPRRVALAFIPALAIGVLAFDAVLALTVRPRAGQENLVLPTLIGLGALFVALQLLHFRLIAWTLRRNRG